MTQEDVEAIEVWPENNDAINVFSAMSTQWNVSHSGATGLIYQSLPVVMEMLGIEKADYPDIFDSIRICEGAALSAMQKNAKT